MAAAHSLWEISSTLAVSRPHISRTTTHQELASFKPHAFSSLTMPCPYHSTHFSLSKTLRAQDLAEQMKEMAAAEKRWRAQVRDGKIQAISPKQAGYAMQLAQYCVLDVRPSTERNKAWVKDSIWIPVFDVDKGFDPETLLKRFSNFTMGYEEWGH